MSRAHTINTLRDTLRKIVTDWKHDSHVPPNFIREDGLGKEIARVDVWAGMQNPRDPFIIGWRARHGEGNFQEGVLTVSQFPSTDAAVEYAKAQADAALLQFGWNIDDPVETKIVPCDRSALFDELLDEYKFAVLGDDEEQAQYESLGHMAYEKGYPLLAHILEPETYPLEE